MRHLWRCSSHRSLPQSRTSQPCSRHQRPHHRSASSNPPRTLPDTRMDYWREARFGLFIKWGLYSTLEGESRGRRIRPGIETRRLDREAPARRLSPCHRTWLCMVGALDCLPQAVGIEFSEGMGASLAAVGDSSRLLHAREHAILLGFEVIARGRLCRSVLLEDLTEPHRVEPVLIEEVQPTSTGRSGKSPAIGPRGMPWAQGWSRSHPGFAGIHRAGEGFRVDSL